MQPFTIVEGIAAPIPGANIDTDVIMPKQFLKGIDRSGLAIGAFHDLRFDAGGEIRSDFILNQADWRDTRFLMTGPNFGCGSSREHAVWGLMQLGIRTLIGTSFAGIFFDNCARNGLLAIVVDAKSAAELMRRANNPRDNRLTIDLPSQTISTSDGVVHAFEIEEERKQALLQGLDAIGATLRHEGAIRQFERAYLADAPWLAD